ncbi:hypothetical protein BpHYR1_014737 [Brachionus plicatilis]|uniref:Uncharacterized protein n=1 Tax=Brachionus plicatilis TaxID=10195 RepID=A0A3M7T750_BRAPC|nr:hypothetical protein BpHYR1_014737 [Brachionus plicatilis]
MDWATKELELGSFGLAEGRKMVRMDCLMVEDTDYMIVVDMEHRVVVDKDCILGSHLLFLAE